MNDSLKKLLDRWRERLGDIQTEIRLNRESLMQLESQERTLRNAADELEDTLLEESGKPPLYALREKQSS